MNDDNPLWYDHAEPDEPPGAVLLVLAALLGMVLGAVTATIYAYWLPDRLLRSVADAIVWCQAHTTR